MSDELQKPAGSIASLARQGKQLQANLRKPLSLESRRIALERKITLNFPHFKGFLTEYSSNISMTGMFVQSEKPEPPGTVLAFEFRLADGLNLIQGQAEVVWRRMREKGPVRPAGMGLKFVRLDKDSRRVIRWAVEKQLREGGTTFDLDGDLDSPLDSGTLNPGTPEDKPEAPASLDAVPLDDQILSDINTGHSGTTDSEARARLHPYAGAAMAKSGSGGWRKLVVSAVALFLAVGLALFLYTRWREQPVTTMTTTTAATPTPVSAPSESVPAPVVPEPMEDVSAAVLDRLEAWALAWSEQQVDEYLGFYSADFQPARGSRETWSAQRRSRIERPQRIEVRISEIETIFPSQERAEVSFLQEYASECYRDTTRKLLELVSENDQWMILKEGSVP